MGGSSTSVGVAVNQVLFKYLDMIFDIFFSTIVEDVSTL